MPGCLVSLFGADFELHCKAFPLGVFIKHPLSGQCPEPGTSLRDWTMPHTLQAVNLIPRGWWVLGAFRQSLETAKGQGVAWLEPAFQRYCL